MKRTLEDFIFALRNTGIRISVSESIDAMNAVMFVGLHDRVVLKDSLRSTLAKSHFEKVIFDECFDSFFCQVGFSDQQGDDLNDSALENTQEISQLTEMILSRDNLGLALSLREAARVVDMTGIQVITQKGVYMQRILSHMGLPELKRDINRFNQENTPDSIENAMALGKARHYLFENVKDFVEQQYAMFSGLANEEIAEWYLRNIKLTNIEGRDLSRIQVIIQRMVKNLNDYHSRRRKTHCRGQLDFKKTIRKNIQYQGLIFEPWWKHKKIDRPDIVAICDISRSVKSVVRFLLLFLYGLNRVISRIRTFIFCSNLVEVSHIFEQCPVEEALAKLQVGAGLPILLGPTDYGHAFSDFKENWIDTITKKTTVIILGDARCNYGNPQRGILKLINNRCKRLIWLNPEDQSLWGAGDSEMPGYRPYCHLVKECNTINHLENVVYDLVKSI